MHLARTARHLGRATFAFQLFFFTGRQGPEKAVGYDVAHARSKARVQRLV